jgi:hypothetical protein
MEEVRSDAPTFGSRDLAPAWRWRDATGNLWPPEQMVTRHLFHTFRMIWNNHMPPEARVGLVRLYRFPSAYTREYLGDAVVALGRELGRREDLLPEWRAQLLRMAMWFGHGEVVDEPRLADRPKALMRPSPSSKGGAHDRPSPPQGEPQ